MNVDELLAVLADRRVTLFLEGEGLQYRAPAGSLTQELRDSIAAYREEIIDHLRDQPDRAKVNTKCVMCDRRSWVDEPPQDRRIRTHCGKCGRFIGYRPAELRMA